MVAGPLAIGELAETIGLRAALLRPASLALVIAIAAHGVTASIPRPLGADVGPSDQSEPQVRLDQRLLEHASTRPT